MKKLQPHVKQHLVHLSRKGLTRKSALERRTANRELREAAYRAWAAKLMRMKPSYIPTTPTARSI